MLITLGIIGIVAAITIPTLVSSYKKKLYSSRLKEFYSVMSQAIQMSEIENGPKSTWKKHSIDENYDEDGNMDYPLIYGYCYEFFITYIAPYLKYTNESIKDDLKFYLVNGTKVSMWNGTCMDMNIDVNGDAGPNKNGVDVYYFTICLDSSKILAPGYSCPECSRDELIQLCKENFAYCTYLLQRDNWEFKKDYPYKI